MPKPTVVADTPVPGQGAVLEMSTDDGTSWDVVPGLLSVPRIGTEGKFIPITSIDQIVDTYIPGKQETPEWELPFERIGTSTEQDELISRAQLKTNVLADKTVRFQSTYQTGDIFQIVVILNGFYADSAEQGDAVQMFAVKGQQSGDVTISKVA